MKSYFHTLQVKFIMCLAAVSCCAGTASAGPNFSSNSVSDVDGNNNAAVVWQTLDSVTGNFFIQGTYIPVGPYTPLIFVITDSTLFNSYRPILACASLPLTDTRAVAVWFANDQTSGNSIIQASTTTEGGWNPPVTLSLIDGSEQPQDAKSVSISPDGTTIYVTWSSYIPNTDDNVIRAVYSIDGGNTWSWPSTVSSQ